jgi:FixJ family two-component response regulator
LSGGQWDETLAFFVWSDGDQMKDANPVVFVVDDDPSIRKSMDRLLRSAGLEVRTFESTDEFQRIERPDAPACLVLDIRMPGKSGLDFQRELAEAGSRIPIIFITGHGDIPMSVRAMKAGAIEFLTKPFPDRDLLDAIQSGIEKDRARRQDAAILGGLKERFGSLNLREREVLTQVAAGRLNKQIAAELGLSEISVKVCRGQVMRKMQASSLAELVRMAERLGISSDKA